MTGLPVMHLDHPVPPQPPLTGHVPEQDPLMWLRRLIGCCARTAAALGLAGQDDLPRALRALFTEPVTLYAAHPNWPSAMAISGPPIEISLRLDHSRPPALRFVTDVTDHRLGLADNWPRYLHHTAAVIGGGGAETLAWQLCGMHLTATPARYRSRVLHGIGYSTGQTRRGTLYFRNRLALHDALPLWHGPADPRALLADARTAATHAELLGYDFSGDRATRTKMFCPLSRAQTLALLEATDHVEPRLGAARLVADTFLAQAREATLFTALQICAEGDRVSRKLYFPCAPWQWVSARGFHALVDFLTVRLGVDLEPLATLLDQFNADALTLSPGFLAVSGPVGSPSVSLYFSPDVLDANWPAESAPVPHQRSRSPRARRCDGVIDDLIANGVRYLAAAQHPGGLWCDFGLDDVPAAQRATPAAGRSTQFVTAFAGACLLGVPEAEDLVAAAAQAIARSAQAGPSWGWNEQSPPDGETTALALRVLLSSGHGVTDAALTQLGRHQRADGGFDACPPGPNAQDEAGTAETTASALLVLLTLAGQAQHHRPGVEDHLAAAIRHLIRAQLRGGAWPCAQWGSPLVATARAIDVFARLDRPDLVDPVRKADILGRGTQALLSWPLAGHPFLLGQWLFGWGLVGGHRSWATVQRILASLSRQQQAGGQWPGSPIRRLPWAVGSGGSAGHQSLLIDRQCVITTASVICGLHALRQPAAQPSKALE